MQLHTAAFAFTRVRNAHTWVKMTLSIEDMLTKENHTAPRFQWREAGAEGMSPVESVTNILKSPGACLVNANAAEARNSAFAPNVVTDAYRPHPPAIGAEWSIPRIRPVP